jgi:hypothetical protein
VDAYTFGGHFYKPRNGKFTFGPDRHSNRSQGSNARGSDWRPFAPRTWMASNPYAAGQYGSAFFQSGPASFLFRWLFTDPDFWQQWIDRYQQHRATALETNHLLANIDRVADQLGETQPRDLRRWNGASGSNPRPRSGVVTSPSGDYTHTFPTPGTLQGEIDFLKRWYVDRINFIDTNFLSRPIFSLNEGLVTVGTSVTLIDKSGKPGTRILYTLDGSDPRGPQGATNLSAREYVAPIRIVGNIRIRARAINPNHRNMTSTNANGSRNPILTTPWSGDNAATFFVSVPSLRITEFMYHPAPSSSGQRECG